MAKKEKKKLYIFGIKEEKWRINPQPPRSPIQFLEANKMKDFAAIIKRWKVVKVVTDNGNYRKRITREHKVVALW